MSSTAEKVHWICKVPLGITLCTFGIIGYLVSIFVWRKVIKTSWVGRSNKNPSTAKYLMLLGVLDTGVLASLLFVDSVPLVQHRAKESYLYGFLYSWMFSPFLFLFFIASVLLVAGVTINRWALVRFPIRSMEYYSKKNTVISLAGVIVLAILLNIPMWFTYEVEILAPQQEEEQQQQEQHGNATITSRKIIDSSTLDCLMGNLSDLFINDPSIKVSLHETKFGRSKAFFCYMSWCHCLLFVDIPWFTVAILNVFIFKRMRERNRIRGVSEQGDLRRKKEERNLTLMLLSSTSAFILCLSMHCISNTWRRITLLQNDQGHNGKLSEDVDIGTAFGRLGIVLNSSTNCLFYCFGGRTFRKTLKTSIIGQPSSMAPIILVNSNRSSKAVVVRMRKLKKVQRVYDSQDGQTNNIKLVCRVKSFTST